MDLFIFQAMRDALSPIADKVWRACEAKNLHSRAATFKVRYANFQQITGRKSIVRPIARPDNLVLRRDGRR